MSEAPIGARDRSGTQEDARPGGNPGRAAKVRPKQKVLYDNPCPGARPAPLTNARQIRVGNCVLAEKPHGKARRRTGATIDYLRLAEIARVIHSRHDGPCDTDDGAQYLHAALPHLVALAAGGLRVMSAEEWRGQLTPHVDPAECARMAAKLAARPRTYRADTVAAILGVTDAERSRLALKTIGATDRTKEQREADRRIEDRNRKRERRRRSGVRAREDGLAATRPWEREGVSRRTWFRRREAGEAR